MSFCCTPMGALVSSSQERYVWRKVCHPIDYPLLTTREAIRLPRMVYAVVAQCPYFRGDLLRFDAAKAKAISGVLGVFDIPTQPTRALNTSAFCRMAQSSPYAPIHSPLDKRGPTR
jgi:hypothetical protein